MSESPTEGNAFSEGAKWILQENVVQNLKNLLTSDTKCAILNTNKGKDTLQTRKDSPP